MRDLLGNEMKETKLKPFVLSEALEGKPVITRDGREVTQLTYFKDVKDTCCIMGVIDDGICSFTIDGSCYSTYSSSLDLFMAPIKTKYYTYVFKVDGIDGFCSYTDTLSYACDSSSTLFKTFEFEVDE